MPNINYTNNIPFASNNPSTDQPDMLINTNSIDTLINVDHVSFNLNNGGTHRQVTVNAQSSPGLGEGTGVYYGDVFPALGATFPAFQNANGAFFLTPVNPISAANNGQSGLPNTVIKWGFQPLAGGTTETGAVIMAPFFDVQTYVVFTSLTYNVALPPTAVGTVAINDLLGNGAFAWTFNGQNRYNGFYWVAIGL